MSENLTYNTVW